MQTSQYKLIEVVCPLCGLAKAVPVPMTLFSEKKFGHVKIQVPKGVACKEHVFIVFLDVQARIIGYETVDISISSLAKFEPREDGSIEDGKTISLREFIEIMGFQCFAGLIHAKLFNYPLYIIVKEEFKVNLNVINNVLEDVMPEMYKNTRSLKTITYPGDVYPVATYFYALVKNKSKATFLMNPRKQIVQMPWKTGLELEKTIINSAVSKEDQNEQLKFLAFYISKFLEDVDKTIIILKTVKKSSIKDLIKKLKEKAITSTVTKNYIISIKEFIHRRISSDIAKKIND
ncbi:MAG: hypothetical protein HWN81_02965 [Candidatus Lokiarchaeota archaeon]|nr:hypothetical protein [Candidatus Lokiarchaeota archaeon]